MLNKDFYKKILLEQKYITEEDAQKAEEFENNKKGFFVDYLIAEEILSQTTLGLAVAEYYQTIFTDLEKKTPSLEDIAKIPEHISKKLRVVFVKEEKNEILVATDNPENIEITEELTKIFPNKKIKISFAFPYAISETLSLIQEELSTRFSEIIKKEKRVAPEIFEEIIEDAISYRSSDIHFEPQENITVVRFRIDGHLKMAGLIPKEYYENVLNRIKIQSNLRTDEHFMPQDGAIRFKRKDTFVDLRVSIVPTLNGEKVVIRVLAEYIKDLNFYDLGFSETHVEKLKNAITKPFGMIIVSGPTGSGKTTTLYSLIKDLNNSETNITTIEDPVEYRLQGANQIQVNQKTGLTFAKGLRAIVRQDPNIILVGEIRDSETVETAINAALTGHLLLSTFHANDAATTIPRLLEMKVEPFLLSSTMELIVAQRLARRICESCRYSYVEKVSNLHPNIRKYFKTKTTTLYKGKGCSLCNHTGYKGRICIVEMIEMSPELKDLVSLRPSARQIVELTQQKGTLRMIDDAIEKTKLGITSLDEIERIVSFKDFNI